MQKSSTRPSTTSKHGLLCKKPFGFAERFFFAPYPVRKRRHRHFANFKDHLKIALYHRLFAEHDLIVPIFLQLDNDSIVALSTAVAPQNFLSVSGYTCIFFAGIVDSVVLLPSGTKLMALHQAWPSRQQCIMYSDIDRLMIAGSSCFRTPLSPRPIPSRTERRLIRARNHYS